MNHQINIMVPKHQLKVNCFEFLMDELVKWVNESGGNPKRDLNLLKVVKLNFFVAAASSSENDEGLLSVFDEFYALPYGHVESDVYNIIKENPKASLNKYTIVPNGISWSNDDIITIDDKYSNSIKSSIDKIKVIDSDFVLRPAGYLVDLSHMWRSWKLMYSTAKSLNKHAIKIPNNLIQTESKIFKLSLQ